MSTDNQTNEPHEHGDSAHDVRPSATLADIAAKAGVSVSTASLALSGKGRVSESVRNKVKAIAESMEYRARVTKQGTQQLIGLVIEDLPFTAFDDAFFSRLIMGVELVLSTEGFRPSLVVVRDKSDGQNLLASAAKEFAGLIVLGGGDLDDDFLSALVRCGPPVVLGDTYLSSEPSHAVIADNFGGACRLISHLVEQGHSRIAMIRGSSKYKPLNDRLMGYAAALASHGIAIDEDLVPPRISHGLDKGYSEMMRLIQLDNPPTAVFACSDRTAFRAMDAAREKGLRIPEDIAVAGFDDIPEASLQTPPLTSVKLPAVDIGRFSAMRLLSCMDGRELGPYVTVLPTELNIRLSTAAVCS